MLPKWPMRSSLRSCVVRSVAGWAAWPRNPFGLTRILRCGNSRRTGSAWASVVTIAPQAPAHGVLVEGVPFARDGARFTRDFEDLIAWLATTTDKTATSRLTRIDWATIGRIIERVDEEQLAASDRLSDLFDLDR